MTEEQLQELDDDIRSVSSRVLTEDRVMNLVEQYQNLIEKYGQEERDTINRQVYGRIRDLLDT